MAETPSERWLRRTRKHTDLIQAKQVSDSLDWQEKGQAAIRLLREHQWVERLVMTDAMQVWRHYCIAGCGNTKEQGHTKDCKLVIEGIIDDN